MKIAETVTFGGSGLDRAAHLRNQPEAIAALAARSDARCFAIWRGKLLMHRDGAQGLVWLPMDHPLFAEATEPPVFLGLDEAGPRFASDVSRFRPTGVDEEALKRFFDPNEYGVPGLPETQRFAEMRGAMMELSPRDAELAATGKAILEWHRSHGFCARCGAESEMINAGWQRSCASCGGQHFPRTDPVVIMLITSGNSVLLGRSPGWPEGMYSLLAGFVEPGETLEAAVRREVLEETQVKVGAVRYLASQPWAFPNSLMFGCEGIAESTEITLDPVELEHALWMTREEVADSFSGTNPSVKPARAGSIAHFLLRNWLADRLD